VGKELSMKMDEEIRGLKERLSDMTLSNYRSEEKVEKLLKDLDVAEDNVLDQHETSDLLLQHSLGRGKVQCRQKLLSGSTCAH